MKPKKILMVSLVPFWYRQTGAQQRMFALVEALRSDQHQVKTFFPMAGFNRDAELIQKYSLDVEQHTSDMRPHRVIPSVVWYFRAVFNQLKMVLEALRYPKQQGARGADRMKLADYRWPWARVAFEQTVNRYQPDIVICQYVTTAWLLDAIPKTQRRDIHCVIDTHDLLSARNEQFEQRGFKHWIDISREEESRALAKFDTVIAIQKIEAQALRLMAPNAQVIVIGHHAGDCEIVRRSKEDSAPVPKLRLGYIASINASNVDAIEGFLDHVWPRIAKDETVELVVAGAICETITQRVYRINGQSDGVVRLLGKVEHVIDFYQEIDVAINPVQFGTGLKVKTVEALAHGVPVVTTEPKVADHDDVQAAAVVYCDTLDGLADEVAGLLSDDGRRYTQLKSAAIAAGKESGKRTRQAVYQKLTDVIAGI